MAEKSKVARKYRRLATNINVPPVDKNLYVRTMRNRNIPYVIRHKQFVNQTSKTQKPDILPRHNCLLTNYKIAAADISTQPPSTIDILMNPDNTFRQMSPPTLPLRYAQMNLTSRFTDPEKSERSLQVHRQDHDNTIPKAIPRPQSATLVRDILDHTKLYYTIKREMHNADGNCEENIYTSECISDRLSKTVLLVKN